MAAVVGDRQLAAREVKSLVVFIVCPGLLADCNGVDIIGAAIYLLLKLDWSVQEFNVIRFDISLQLDCLRLVPITSLLPSAPWIRTLLKSAVSSVTELST